MARRNPGFVSKRPHKKSRAGCVTCKKKKVKCDEGQPACSYCALRSITCIYPPPEQARSRESTTPRDSSEDLTPVSAQMIPACYTSSGQFSSLEFELMHHYKGSVWPTLSGRVDESIQYLNRDWVPIKSVSTDYLRFSILSMSASHLNLMTPSIRLETAALHYRQKAIKSYMAALNNITSDNYQTLLMTSLYMMGMVSPPEQPCTDDECIKWMNALFRMMQGLRVLAGLKWIAGIEKLEVYPIFRREVKTLPAPPPIRSLPSDPKFWSTKRAGGDDPVRPNPPSTYETPTPNATPSPPQSPASVSSGKDMSDLPFRPLQLMSAGHTPYAPQSWKKPPSWELPFPAFLPPPLMSILKRTVEPPWEQKSLDLHAPILLPSIHALSPIFLSLYYYHLHPDFFTRIIVFPTFLPPPFFQLVAQKEPRALIIVGWWFALIRLSPNTWWIDKFVPRTLQAISNEIMRSNDKGYMDAMEGAYRISKEVDKDGGGKRGRERAAIKVFEGWDGVIWEEGPIMEEKLRFEEYADIPQV
ncbi:unnamed protein product [Periconia digitata]|uniref:Zn(2)-C6 fungal-type domain-containing protein n=1 Tax=Periconia digitata TaxID=1303443 RepID=A0A9W4USF0_9PLEO|nr:unnamed protein product [Periconia digitata]